MSLAVSLAQTFAGVAAVGVAVLALARSRSARLADVRRARLERVLEEILRYVETIATSAEKWGQGASLAAARARLDAALIVAGGPAAFPGTDLLVRVPVASAADQSQQALLEITKAISALH